MSDLSSPPTPTPHRGVRLWFRAHSHDSNSSVSDEIELNQGFLFSKDRVYASETPTETTDISDDDDNQMPKVIEETTPDTDNQDCPNDSDCDGNDQRSRSDIFGDSDDEMPADDDEGDDDDDEYQEQYDYWAPYEFDYDGDDEDSDDEDCNRHFYYEYEPENEDDLPEGTYEEWCQKYNRL